MKKKILITGSEGLVGSSIIKFISKNKYKLIKIDKKINKSHFVEKKNFVKVLDNKKPDIIIHAAAHPGGLSMKDPLMNTKINITGSMNIINWCMKNNKKLIFLSSSAVYGDQKKGKLNEKTRLNPTTIYGINKVAVERYITELSKYNKFPWIILRLFATYGHGHSPNLFQGIVNVIITQLKKGNILDIKGSLNRTRDLIYADDVGKIISIIISKDLNEKIINIGTGKSSKINQIINICQKNLKKNKITIKILDKTPGDPFSSVADITLLRKYIKKFKFTNISKGIKETIDKLV